MRTGLIARKLGMTRLFLEGNNHYPVTVLVVDSCQVIAKKDPQKDGYNALQLGAGKAKAKNIARSLREIYARVKIEPKAKLKEFTVTSENILEVGTEIIPSHFVVGQYVDVEGTSIGKGFAGAMKRHNFAGLRASHGVSISHRSHGSTGNSQDPGKVWKGKKMAGQMGNVRVTLNNLQIMSTDDDRGLILIKGGVPGPKGSWVFIKDSKKKALPPGVPYPAGIRGSVADKQNGIENTLSDTNDSLGHENLKGKEELNPIEELSEKTSDLSKGTEKESPVEGDKEK